MCAAAERPLLAADPKRLLWTLFAAKEAAFKALSKALPGPLVFAHRKFVVGADLRSVAYEGYPLWLRVVDDGPCVHAVVWSDDEPPLHGVGPAGDDPSADARALLLKRLGVPGLTVEREPQPGSWNGFGPPKLFRDGTRVNLDISLSHDGRFVAYAADSSGAEHRR